MTLKEYLEENQLYATPDQRSQIGYLLSQTGDNKGYVLEDGYNVKNYYKSFLNSERTSDIIINYFNKG